MKNFRIISTFLLAAGLMACSNQEVANPAPDKNQDTFSEDTPILLTSTVIPTRTSNTELQKTQLESGVQIGLFIMHEDKSLKYENEPLTADGKGYFSGSTLYFPDEGAVSIFAYAPYNESWIFGDNDFSVSTDQSTDQGYLDSDLLYGEPNGDNKYDKNTTTAISLAHAHKLAKITVKFNVLDESDLTGAEISILNTLPSVTINTKYGGISQAKGKMSEIKAHVSKTTKGEDASVIIIPQTLREGTPFIQVVSADGKKTLQAPLNTNVTFLEGKSYTYTVNLSTFTAEIALASSIDDWAGGDNLQGEAEEVDMP